MQRKDKDETSQPLQVGKQSSELRTNTSKICVTLWSGLTSGSDDLEKWWLGEVLT